MSLQQLQQEIQKMSATPQEYQDMIAAMQKMNEFAQQTNVQEMQEGGLLQKQEQEGGFSHAQNTDKAILGE